ncbi:MAG: hypothetical protein QOC57_58, partial [Ilumatobacteraceae bacterium]
GRSVDEAAEEQGELETEAPTPD